MKYISTNFKIHLFLFVLLNVSLSCGGSPNSSPTTPTSTTEENAWSACKLLIEMQLKISPRDAQEYNPSGVTPIDNDHYLVAIYYAKYSDTYQCFLRHDSDGDWNLLELKVLQ